jgi:ubiquinone/menaquinone biosynthesis C-methylase UbiE
LLLGLILDVGTADGLVLEKVQREFAVPISVGIDRSYELLRTNSNPCLHLIQADAHRLPFGDNHFDTVIATALIEHVSEPPQVVRECYRVLQPHGLCLVTTPVPFFERVATLLGHLEDAGHVQTFSLSQLKEVFEGCGFEVIEAAKFMLSPIGLPFETALEKVLSRLGLHYLFLNQLLVGRKSLHKTTEGSI